MIKRLFGVLAAFGFIAGLTAAAVAQSSPAMTVPKKIKVTYRCEGLKVVAYYDNVRNRVAFVYGARHYTLPHAPSADGARYLGKGLEWWEKGNNVTISSVDAGSTTADNVLAKCVAAAK
jgi:membrane-bound inhibitor of C-type lysozyme